MRRVLPDPGEEMDDADLAEAYAYPAGRAWVRANMVAAVDGSATAEGRSGGLSGTADKRVFRTLRGLCDVVLIGAGTVRAEGYGPARPQQAYAGRRAAAGQPPAPAMAVVSARLDLDTGSRLFAAAVTPTIVITCGAADAERLRAIRQVADVVVAGDDRVDLVGGLAGLAERGLERVLCEGGPSLLAQLVGAGALDDLCLTFSPALVGGAGPRILAGSALDRPLALQLAHLLADGDVLLARYLLRRPGRTAP